jgi:Flp pilus assembly protein TadD
MGALFALALLAAPGASRAEGAINWSHDYDPAVKSAATGHKLVLMEFYFDTCIWCHKMARGAFSDQRVVDRINQFVPLRVNGKKGDGIPIAERYKIPGYPTFIVLNESGVEIDRKVGFLKADEMLSWTGSVQKGEGTFAAVEAAYKKNPADNAAAAAYAAKLSERGDGAALPIYEKLAVADPDNKAGYLEDALGAMADAARMNKDNAAAEAHLQRLIQVARKPESQESGLHGLARLRFRATKTAKGDEKQKLADDCILYQKTLTEKLPEDYTGYADALNDLAYYVIELKGDEKLAVAAAEKAVAHERDPEYLDTLAELRFRAGNLDEALKLQREAVAAMPGDESLADDLKKFEAEKAKQTKPVAKAGKSK